jgi:hypothetical protein
MVALGLRTASLDAASTALRRGGIAPAEAPGRLIVPASSACGLALAFMA